MKRSLENTLVIGFSVFIFLLMVAFAMRSPSSSPEKSVSTPAISPKTSPTKTVKATPVYDYIKEAKIASKTITDKSPWDENSAVKNAFSAFVKLGQIAFKDDKVRHISLEYQTGFTDSYGKNTTQPAVILKMSKSKFRKYNWKNLEYRSIYYQLEQDCDHFYIHSGIMKNINPEKIYYNPSYELK